MHNLFHGPRLDSDRAASQWAMRKDIIRLRSDVASLGAKVDSLSAQVQNTYPRELMDEKLHQRDRNCHGAGKDRARH